MSKKIGTSEELYTHHDMRRERNSGMQQLHMFHPFILWLEAVEYCANSILVKAVMFSFRIRAQVLVV